MVLVLHHPHLPRRQLMCTCLAQTNPAPILGLSTCHRGITKSPRYDIANHDPVAGGGQEGPTIVGDVAN